MTYDFSQALCPGDRPSHKDLQGELVVHELFSSILQEICDEVSEDKRPNKVWRWVGRKLSRPGASYWQGRDTQGLFLTLCSGVTPDDTCQGAICGTRDRTQVCSVQGRYCCSSSGMWSWMKRLVEGLDR